jgi:DNA-binding transcriptional ArsR family regulator
MVAMHLVPADRADRHIIDDHRVCQAIAGLGADEQRQTWAQRFALLADPNRLAILLAIHHAPEICVTDLAVATGLNDTTVSQALRLLRGHQVVAARRDGRIIRYRLADEDIHLLLHQLPQLATPTS